MDEPSSQSPALFGLPTCVFLMVSSMVGVGIVTTSGYTVAEVGSNQVMIGLWLAGGLTALCGGLSLAEVAAALPRSGGDYVYAREIYGPFWGFLNGWVTLLFGFAAPIAVTALSSAAYWLAPWQASHADAWQLQPLLATIFVLSISLLHLRGHKHTAHFQAATTITVLIAMLAFIGFGLYAGRTRFAQLEDAPPWRDAPWSDMLFASVYIYYGYAGWNAASYIAGEVKTPQRLLPRAIVGGVFLVILLYIGMNLVYALALPASEIQALARTDPNSVGPIAELAAQRLFGKAAATPMALFTGFLLLTMLSAFLVTGPRVALAMALQGQLPSVMARRIPGRATPGPATLFVAVVGIIMIWTPSTESIIVYSSLGLALMSMMTVGAVFLIRRRRPDLRRPFQTPGYPVTPCIYLGATAAISLAVIRSKPLIALFCVLTLLIGALLYHSTKPKPAPLTPD